MKTIPLILLLGVPSFTRAAEPDRSQTVPAGPERPHQLAPVQTSKAAGLDLALIEMRRLPLVSVRLVIPLGGSALDPQGKAGLADLVAELMMEGAGNLDSRRFAEALDDIGATVGFTSTSDALQVTIFCAKENIDEAMGLAALAIQKPQLPRKPFNRIKEEALAALEEEKGSPGGMASKRLWPRVYSGHPYGVAADEGSLKSITLADAQAFAATRLSPAGAFAAASGDLTLPEFETLIKKHFGSWRQQPGAALPAVAAVAVSSGASPGIVIDVVDMPGSDQSAIRAGQLALKRGDPDHVNVAVLSYLLGEASTISRLNKNLRETHGWTYGAGSELDAQKVGGDISIKTDVQTDATAAAVTEIIKELRRLQDELVPDAELETAKRLMLGDKVRGQQKVQDLSAAVAMIQLHGLPADELSTYRARVAAVTPKQLQATALKYLRPDSLHVVVSGDASKIVADLKAIGAVRVFDADGNPKTVAVAAPATAPAGAKTK